jgi:hypothetical protein
MNQFTRKYSITAGKDTILMEPRYLLLPMLAQVILTGCVLIIMRIRREKAVKDEGLNPLYFKTKQIGDPPRLMKQADDLVENLFEVPMLLFTGCLAAMVMNLVDPVLLGLACAYVGLRIWHALEVLKKNRILKRARIWATSIFIIISFWFWLVIAAFI